MTRRRHIGPSCFAQGEAERMIDYPFLHGFVVAHEAGENRKTRSIGRRPPCLPDLVLSQIPDCAATRLPPAVLFWKGIEQLEQRPCIAVEHEHMPVPVTVRTTLDRGVWGDGVGSRIAFFGVFEC